MPLWPWQRKQQAKDARDERVVAAEAALKDWAARLEAPGADAAKGDHLVRCVQLLLQAPPGQERDALVEAELRNLLPLALLPGAEKDLDLQLQLVKEAFDSQDLQDALAGTLAALARDARLDQLMSAAEVDSGNKDRFERLAVACQQAMSLDDAEKRCEEVLRLRHLALHQADALLGRPKRAASQRIAEASERKRLLQEQQAAVAERFHSLRMVPLEEEGLSLERSLESLSERQRELRMELDAVSRKLDDARAKQRGAMAQVDGWRAHLAEVKSSKVKAQMEHASEAEVVQLERSGCTDLLDAVRGMRNNAKEALVTEDAEAEEQLRAADAGAAESSAGACAVGDAWLADALAGVERWQAEDARAVQTLELMGVDGAERELPTRRELPAVLAALRMALEQREALGDDEPSRRSEAIGLLAKLEPLVGGSAVTVGAASTAGAAPTAGAAAVAGAGPDGPRLLEPSAAPAGRLAPSPRPAPIISDFAMELEESLTSPAAVPS